MKGLNTMEKQIYLLLTDTGTIFTRMIKLYTKKSYNHASLSFDLFLNDVYSFGRKNIKNPFIGGFVKEDMENDLFRYANCAIYCCTISEEQWNRVKAYILQIEQQKYRYKYNFIGLFGVMLNRHIQRENAFFCSQFVATALKESIIADFHKPLSLVTPHDLSRIASFDLIFKGKLADYKNYQVKEKEKKTFTSSFSNMTAI